MRAGSAGPHTEKVKVKYCDHHLLTHSSVQNNPPEPGWEVGGDTGGENLSKVGGSHLHISNISPQSASLGSLQTHQPNLIKLVQNLLLPPYWVHILCVKELKP